MSLVGLSAMVVDIKRKVELKIRLDDEEFLTPENCC